MKQYLLYTIFSMLILILGTHTGHAADTFPPPPPPKPQEPYDPFEPPMATPVVVAPLPSNTPAQIISEVFPLPPTATPISLPTATPVVPAVASPATIAPANTPLLPIVVSSDTGTHFMRAADWQPFEIRGVNYVRVTTTDPRLCPELYFSDHTHCMWNSDAIAYDMEQLHAHGVNTVRVFLNYYSFGGAIGTEYSPQTENAGDAQNHATTLLQSLNHFETFLSIANSHNIYVMPVLMAKYPQNSHFDVVNFAEVMKNHVRPIVSRFANHPGIIAWDLFNEPDIAGPMDVRCWDWDNADYDLCHAIATQRLLFLHMLRDEVKALDPHTPLTVSVAFAKSYFRPPNVYSVRLADIVDFYAFHYYDNDPYDSGRYAAHWYYGEGFPRDVERSIDELHALGLNKPVVLTEVGFPSGDGTQRTIEDAQRDMCLVRDTARARAVSGMVLWLFQEQPTLGIANLFQ